MQHTLVIDQGTHASRAIVFDEAGKVIASKEHHVPIYRHNSVKVEQTPEKILASIYYCLDYLAQENSLHHVTQAALVTQRSTVVAWHRQTGKALSPAISWQDTRAADLLDCFDDEDQLHQVTGLVRSPHYGASKIRWLLQNNSACQHALGEDSLVIAPLASYLIRHLTHGEGTLIDYVNASRTLLFDIRQTTWSPELLDKAGIPVSILPECRPNISDYGRIRTFGIPLTLVTGDQNAALFSEGLPPDDTLIVNIGSGAFVIRPTEAILDSGQRLLNGIANSNKPTLYLQEGTVNGAGSALSQIATEVGEQHLFELLPRWLNVVQEPPVFINTIGGLGSPWWHSDIAPGFVDYPDFLPDLPERCVAVVESVVFLLGKNIELIKQPQHRVIRISGGLARLDGLCQKLASLSGIPVQRVSQLEATARGAAWLLGDQQIADTSVDKTFEPAPEPGLMQRYSTFNKELARLITSQQMALS